MLFFLPSLDFVDKDIKRQKRPQSRKGRKEGKGVTKVTKRDTKDLEELLHLRRRSQSPTIKPTRFCLITLFKYVHSCVITLQGSAKELSLGCVKRATAARGGQDAGITQPRDHSLADFYTPPTKKS